MNEEWIRCVVCHRRDTRNGMVCDRDRATIIENLIEIPKLHANLPQQFAPGNGASEKVSGSREAPLPLRIEPLDLTMPARIPELSEAARRFPEDHVGNLSVATVLWQWVDDWIDTRAMRETPPVPTVPILAAWLRVRVDWACDHHPAIDDFAEEMGKLVRLLRTIAGLRSDRIHVGQCPVTDDKGTCGAALTADPYLDAIRCPRCDTLWTRDKWIWLGRTIRAA